MLFNFLKSVINNYYVFSSLMLLKINVLFENVNVTIIKKRKDLEK